jgi:hypothetical protein
LIRSAQPPANISGASGNMHYNEIRQHNAQLQAAIEQANQLVAALLAEVVAQLANIEKLKAEIIPQAPS